MTVCELHRNTTRQVPRSMSEKAQPFTAAKAEQRPPTMRALQPRPGCVRSFGSMKRSSVAFVAVVVFICLLTSVGPPKRSEPVDGWLALISGPEFRSWTNSACEQQTVVSFTVSNAGPRVAMFRLGELQWMAKDDDARGSWPALPSGMASLPHGATTSLTVSTKSAVPLPTPAIGYRWEIPWWEEPEEAGVLRRLLEDLEFNFSLRLWKFQPSRKGILSDSINLTHAESSDLSDWSPDRDYQRYLRSLVRVPNQTLQPTRPRLDVSNDP